MGGYTTGGSEPSNDIRIDYEGGANIIYLGKAAAGAITASPNWQIQKFIYSNNNLTGISYADGVDIFIKVWDDRASYAYP